MSQISHIKYKDIIEAWRFDADFFRPDFIEIENTLKNNKCDEFINLCHFVKKWIFDMPPTKYRNKWIPFLRVSNTKSFFINTSDLVYLDEETNNENKWTELSLWDIVLSKVGTIWDAVINLDYEKVNISQNNIGIKIKHNLIDSWFIVAFLNSKYGKWQIKKKQSWQVQEKLVLDDIKYLQIPRINNEKWIWDLVRLAYKNQQKSKQLYQEAEDLLLTELWLKGHTISHTLTFSTTKKAVDEAWRYDADYFQPKYDELIEKIENYKWGWDYVENLFKQNLSVAKTDSETCNYVEIWDINISNWEIIPNEIFVSDLPANWKRVLKKNDLLISKVRPYRWAVSFIDFECENLIWSWAFTILQEKSDYKKEVLMVFLKTECIKDLLLRYNCGTSYPVIKDETILKLKLPLINSELQKQISNKIQESFKLRNESKELLEQAKKMVEDEIEK